MKPISMPPRWPSNKRLPGVENSSSASSSSSSIRISALSPSVRILTAFFPILITVSSPVSSTVTISPIVMRAVSSPSPGRAGDSGSSIIISSASSAGRFPSSAGSASASCLRVSASAALMSVFAFRVSGGVTVPASASSFSNSFSFSSFSCACTGRISAIITVTVNNVLFMAFI